MRFYEVVTPLQTQLAELRARKDTLSEELDLHRNQTKALMEVNPAFELVSLLKINPDLFKKTTQHFFLNYITYVIQKNESSVPNRF